MFYVGYVLSFDNVCRSALLSLAGWIFVIKNIVRIRNSTHIRINEVALNLARLVRLAFSQTVLYQRENNKLNIIDIGTRLSVTLKLCLREWYDICIIKAW